MHVSRMLSQLRDWNVFACPLSMITPTWTHWMRRLTKVLALAPHVASTPVNLSPTSPWLLLSGHGHLLGIMPLSTQFSTWFQAALSSDRPEYSEPDFMSRQCRQYPSTVVPSCIPIHTSRMVLRLNLEKSTTVIVPE